MTALDRLAELVEGSDPALHGRVQGAAELAELARREAWPQGSVAAFVLPLGLVGRSDGEASAGAYTQIVDELFGVVLFLRAAGDITGGKSLPRLDALIWTIIGAVAGQDTDEAIGVFALRRGQLLKADAGVVLYQLDFALQLQVRT